MMSVETREEKREEGIKEKGQGTDAATAASSGFKYLNTAALMEDEALSFLPGSTPAWSSRPSRPSRPQTLHHINKVYKCS